MSEVLAEANSYELVSGDCSVRLGYSYEFTDDLNRIEIEQYRPAKVPGTEAVGKIFDELSKKEQRDGFDKLSRDWISFARPSIGAFCEEVERFPGIITGLGYRGTEETIFKGDEAVDRG